jgi:hypothetical protein
MVWSFTSDGDVFLGRDAADLRRVQDVPERSIVQTSEEFRFQRSRTGRGDGHLMQPAAQKLIPLYSNEVERKGQLPAITGANRTALRLASQ